MKVRSLTKETPFCCIQSDSVQFAGELMNRHDIGAVPVVIDNEERKLIGIVTDRDLCLRIVASGRSVHGLKVGEVMTKDVVTCHPDASLSSCEALMQRQQVRRVPVVDDEGRCIGIVAQADIALHDSAQNTAHTVAAISKRRHHAVTKEEESNVAVA